MCYTKGFIEKAEEFKKILPYCGRNRNAFVLKPFSKKISCLLGTIKQIVTFLSGKVSFPNFSWTLTGKWFRPVESLKENGFLEQTLLS